MDHIDAMKVFVTALDERRLAGAARTLADDGQIRLVPNARSNDLSSVSIPAQAEITRAPGQGPETRAGGARSRLVDRRD
ncbi:MAG TPA: hypothetical protein VGI79_01640 [Caulobacteraceae bacterium]